MRLEAQLARLRQAEHTLQARYQHAATCGNQFAQHWRSSWTPGRIIGAGLLTGFATGLTKPHALVRSGELLKLITTASNLLTALGVHASVPAAEAAHTDAQATDVSPD